MLFGGVKMVCACAGQVAGQWFVDGQRAFWCMAPAIQLRQTAGLSARMVELRGDRPDPSCAPEGR